MIAKRDSYWDNIKGLLIILVVIGHLAECYMYTSLAMERIWTIIYSFHMPLFIIINGYFAGKSNKSSAPKALKMLRYYLLMQVLFEVINVLWFEREFKWQIFMNPEFCCWYLIFLVYAYCSMFFFDKKDNKQMQKAMAISLGIGLLAGFDTSIGVPYAGSRTLYFLPYFLFGVYLANNAQIFDKIRQGSRILKSVGLVCAMGAMLYVMEKFGNRWSFSGHRPYIELYETAIEGFAFRVFAYLIAGIIGYLILGIAGGKKTIFSFVGRHSLLVYLVHIMVVSFGFRLIQDLVFVGNVVLNHLVLLSVLAIAIILICLVIGFIGKLFRRES